MTEASFADQTLGEKRVRISFNPSNDGEVDILKQIAADFIDRCTSLTTENGASEKNRCISLAQTHAEIAAMFAVKAATTPK